MFEKPYTWEQFMAAIKPRLPFSRDPGVDITGVHEGQITEIDIFHGVVWVQFADLPAPIDFDRSDFPSDVILAIGQKVKWTEGFDRRPGWYGRCNTLTLEPT